MVSIFSADWRNDLLRWIADAGNITTGTIADARISNTLPPDKAFRRGNILGPVSQLGGVPSGALVNWGSNPNGAFVQIADGTQICGVTNSTSNQAINSAYGSLFVGSRTWNFPAEFAAPPSVPAPGVVWGSGASWGSITSAPTATAVTFRIFDAISRATGTSFQFSFFAEGRWFI